jgi:hypothetical protein
MISILMSGYLRRSGRSFGHRIASAARGDPDRPGGPLAEFADRLQLGVDLLEARACHPQQAFTGFGG